MLTANKTERELIAKFIDKAQQTVSGVKILFAEKFSDDSDTYLRLGLELPSALSIDNKFELEQLQKLSSALPIHPKYSLSVTYVDVCDLDHALSISFLPEKYVSKKTYEKVGFVQRFFDGMFRTTYVRRGAWTLTASCLVFGLAIWLWFKFVTPPDEIMPYLSDTMLRYRGIDYCSVAEDEGSEHARVKAQAAAQVLEDALTKYDMEIARATPKDDDRRFGDKRGHIRGLIEILQNDPFVGLNLKQPK